MSAAAKSQPESSAAASSAQAAQQEEIPQEASPKPKPQGLPPLIQQLLSRTAPIRPPASAAPSPQSSTSQSQPPASSVPGENSAGATPVSQFGTVSAEATSATPGPVFVSLTGGAPQLPVKFGSMSPLPPPAPALRPPPEAQVGVLELLQGQPEGQQSSAHSAVPNQQIDTMLDLGPAQHSRPAEQSARSSQRRPQPKAASTNGPAKQAGGPTVLVAQVSAAGAAHTGAHMQQLPASPAARSSPRLAYAPSRDPPKATQPYSTVSEGPPAALQRPQPQQRPLPAPEAHTGGHMQHSPASVAASMPPQTAYSPSTSASQPPGAVQRQQPLQRPQPAQRPQPNGIQRPQPSPRAPPPGFSNRPGSAQTGEGVSYPGAGCVQQPSSAQTGEGVTYAGTDSAQQPEYRKSTELHSPAVPTKGMGPVQAGSASKAATASPQPGTAGEQSSKAPGQTVAGKEAKAQPPAKPLGGSIRSQSSSSSSSSMRNGHPATNGSWQISGHSASTGAMYSKAWRDAQDRQLQRKAVLKAGDPDNIPDSFCCPITHVSQLRPCAGMHEIHALMRSDECMPMVGHLEEVLIMCAA